MDGINLTIGASAVSAIVGAAVAYWKTKQPIRAELKQPLDVNVADKFATREEIASFEKRLNTFATKDEIETLRHEMYSIREQLKENDNADENRTRGVHKRIDELMRIMLECAKKR